MNRSSLKIATALFAIPMLTAVTTGAHAAPSDSSDALKQQLQSLQAQIAELSKRIDAKDAETQKLTTEVQNVRASEKANKPSTVVSMVNGAPTISSADGAFSMTLTGLVQGDWAYYMQNKKASQNGSAYGPDLSSGTNIRRSAIGVRGRVFGDWSYFLLYTFGNSATETPGSILYSYVQYDGLGPWSIRAGAIAPPSSFEDGTSPADTMFLERNSPSNMQRNLAGAEGRLGATISYADDRLFGALSYSGGRVQDAAVFDEQMAVVGRLSYVVYADKATDAHFVLGGNFLHIFKLPDAVPNGSATAQTTVGGTPLHTICLADFPELTVDSSASKLVSTGNLQANHVTSLGLEAAGNWKNFYAQSGYYNYQVDRAPTSYNVYSSATAYTAQSVTPSDNSFYGWYLQGSWVLTGESRPYVKTSGVFASPKPAKPFSLKTGDIGAWEFVARFSELNLNSHTGDASNVVTGWSGSQRTYTYYNTVRGGDQKVVTAGLNWYPNSSIRVAFNYLHVDVARTQAPGPVTTATTPSLPYVDVGQSYDCAALRLQVAF